jgi:hypothetical protein
MCAGQLQNVAKEMDEQKARLDFRGVFDAVDCDRDGNLQETTPTQSDK